MRIMEGLEQDVNRQEASDLFTGTDPDGDPNTHFAEFLAFYAKKFSKSKTNLEELEQVFDMFDVRNEDRKLNKQDFELLEELTGVGLTSEEIDAVFERADKDKDQRLNFDEFNDLMIQADRHVKDKGAG